MLLPPTTKNNKYATVKRNGESHPYKWVAQEFTRVVETASRSDGKIE